MTERIDLRHVAGAADKRVVCRHAAIVFETERLAAVIAGVLRAVLLLALADGEKEEAVAIKGDAPAEVGFRLAPRVGDEDLLEIRHRRAGPPRACQHGGGPLVRPGLRVAQIQQLVLAKLRMQGDVEQAGQPPVVDRGYALDWLRIEDAVANDAQPSASLGHEHLRRRGGMPGSTDARARWRPPSHAPGSSEVKSVTGSDGNGGEAARADFCAPTVVPSDARTMTRPHASRFCISRIVA